MNEKAPNWHVAPKTNRFDSGRRLNSTQWMSQWMNECLNEWISNIAHDATRLQHNYHWRSSFACRFFSKDLQVASFKLICLLVFACATSCCIAQFNSQTIASWVCKQEPQQTNTILPRIWIPWEITHTQRKKRFAIRLFVCAVLVQSKRCRQVSHCQSHDYIRWVLISRTVATCRFRRKQQQQQQLDVDSVVWLLFAIQRALLLLLKTHHTFCELSIEKSMFIWEKIEPQLSC